MPETTRRTFLGGAVGAAAGMAALLAGCSQRAQRIGLADAAELATGALLEMLIGPPPSQAVTLSAPLDPPLLKKGGYETVLIAADVASFVSVSKGSLQAGDLEATQKRVVADVDKILKRRGFSAQAVSFPPQVPAGTEKALVATLTPATEQGGSPKDRAAGKAAVLVLVHLAITDPATGQMLRARDFYSGRDVAGTGNTPKAGDYNGT